MPNDDPFIITVRLEDRINRLLSKLKSLGTISEERYKYLYAAGTAPGILYGLAKTHKLGIPLRPILAAYKTAMFKGIDYPKLANFPILFFFMLKIKLYVCRNLCDNFRQIEQKMKKL